ncbi:MAG: hypothetical protein A2W80_08440 [Candidatus Riflebacteria bacterium GWC2_50_8]|nr:MAG: hypothetical protein A2W80_08440 [Candidatus Riflebacteria bacterium GWC2_50_8]
MVRPLYPLKTPPGQKPEKTAVPLYKNPHLMGALALVAVLLVLVVYHFSRSGVIDPDALPASSQSGGSIFSFLKPTRFSAGSRDLQTKHEQQMAKMGLATETEALSRPVEAKDLREQRRIMAIQKYEASREVADRFQQEREELRSRLNSPSSLQLKDAVMALEDSDNLGIMKLERLLEEKLHSQGASRQDMDVIVYAYDSLAKVYERKNMPEKAKDAYLNVFHLMKKQAPDSQGPDWDAAIANIEQLSSRPRGN